MCKSDNVDVVITWVNGADSTWLEECSIYSKKPLDRVRFEDGGTIKYLFRSIDLFMPWVNNVFLVTPGHYPEWLNIEHPKLNLINQSDLFNNKSDLPIFNSCSVEANIHRIPNLSNKFIFFNDDMVILKKISKDYFFLNGKPNDFFIISRLFHDNIFSHQMHSQMQYINKTINEEKTYIKQVLKALNLRYGLLNIFNSILLLVLNKGEIPLFKLNHQPQAYLKSCFFDFEKEYPEIIKETSSSRFRTEYQISQTMFRFWSLVKGNYNPKYHNDSVYLGVSGLDKFKKDLIKIDKKDVSMICFNEHKDFDTSIYSEYKKSISEFLDKYLGSKSSFEI